MAKRKSTRQARKPAQKKAAHRDAQVTIILGKNGTGKSTFCYKLLDNVPGRKLVVTMNGLPKIWRDLPVIDPAKPLDPKWKNGFRQCYAAQHEEDTFKHLARNFRSGLIIFDDCKDYIPERVTQIPALKSMLINFRHKELDLFFIAHSPADVPKQVWMYSSDVFIGATPALFQKNQVALGHADRILEAQRKVNAEFSRRKALKDNSHYGLFIQVKP